VPALRRYAADESYPAKAGEIIGCWMEFYNGNRREVINRQRLEEAA